MPSSGLRSLSTALLFGFLASACSSSDDSGKGGSASCDVTTCEYDEPTLWQSPITDYIEGTADTIDPEKLHRSIDDLFVFDDRLYFGYGDGTNNAGGQVPIQIRYWASPDDTKPNAEELVTEEEEVLQYRTFGDTLYFAGPDPIIDGLYGHAFRKPSGKPFEKYYGIPGALHVHDIAEFKGALYTCGSGLPVEAPDTGNKVSSWLWRSDDNGKNWTVAAQIENTVAGDRRWRQMAPFADGLEIFGYRANIGGQLVELTSATWDGETLTEEAFSPEHLVESVDMFNANTAIVRGVYAAGPAPLWRALTLSPGEPVKEWDALAGMSLLDTFILEEGKALLLAIEGDAYPTPATPTPVHVYYTDDLSAVTELFTAELTATPTAIAYWHGGIYIGLANGDVFRSLPAN